MAPTSRLDFQSGGFVTPLATAMTEAAMPLDVSPCSFFKLSEFVHLFVFVFVVWFLLFGDCVSCVFVAFLYPGVGCENTGAHV